MTDHEAAEETDAAFPKRPFLYSKVPGHLRQCPPPCQPKASGSSPSPWGQFEDVDKMAAPAAAISTRHFHWSSTSNMISSSMAGNGEPDLTRIMTRLESMRTSAANSPSLACAASLPVAPELQRPKAARAASMSGDGEGHGHFHRGHAVVLVRRAAMAWLEGSRAA
mmetsp:Transcript_36253/g.99918  ORF Transcript_36253/g.99918 Transcript_36253/m.99918 type:complete len:166 (+) Transcript_36253:1904-2401(+)